MVRFRTRTSYLLLIICWFISPNLHAQPVDTVTVGDPASMLNNIYAPINTYYGHSYVQQLYLASEINKPQGGTITMIRFYWSGGTANLNNSNNWTLFIGHTNKTAFNSLSDWVPYAGLTQAFSGIIIPPNTNQWIDIPLATPFVYDGISSIVIAGWETTPGYSSYNSTFRATWTTSTRTIGFYSDVIVPSPTAPPTAIAAHTSYPNIQFEFLVDPDNTGISAITLPAEGIAFCSGPQLVTANIHNYGNSVVNNVTVHWTIDGVAQAPVNYTTPIDMENTIAGPDAEVVLGVVVFPYNSPLTIAAWTSMPNGVNDTNGENDSTSRTITAELQGITDFNIIPADTLICEGDSITMDAGLHPNDPVYVWSEGSVMQHLTVAAGGAYWVTVQNADGCSATDTVNVTVHPDPVASDIAVIDNGDGTFTFSLMGPQFIDNHYWDFGNGITRIGPGPHTVEYAEGIYNATVTLSNMCGQITLTRVITATGITEWNGISPLVDVYPNPGSDIITLRSSGDVQLQQLKVYNLLGQEVLRADVHAHTYVWHVSQLANGVYHLVLETNKGLVRKKIEVLR